MKLRFKHQNYQKEAVQAITGVFAGQPNHSDIRYRLDVGRVGESRLEYAEYETGFRNAAIQLSDDDLLKNIQDIQFKSGIPVSSSIVKTSVCKLNLDIEMETGTGKTYVYIRSIYELNRLYGWSKFIIVVPSIAIREGVAKSFEITEDHFLEDYGKRIRYFIYNSGQLHNLEAFSSDASINVMIINVQAFNAKGADARKIYEKLDSFQSRRPIDVIKANHPILILDEPQKMEGEKTLDALKEFNPLMIFRYSATHKTSYNKIYRLDALDAYNQKLVKKIAVRGIAVKGLPGTNPYLYLDTIEISSQAPVARMEIEVKVNNGIKRTLRLLKKTDNLFDISGRLSQYSGFVVSEIDALHGKVHFTNGVEILVGEISGDVSETLLRRLQIREAIRAHFEKERTLFRRGIKVLTLFFIDTVAKYRVYSESAEEDGEYAKMFEEEYQAYLEELNQELNFDPDYRSYVNAIEVAKTHNGYFSIDKKTRHLSDPAARRGTSETDDVDAYDLILKDKERLLSLEEPTRFIFSHSALREGWDNPNVFVICTLKHSDNTITRRQEVGRGLRLAVNNQGERQDQPATVHQINRLTVVASESYTDFVSGLQKEVRESLSSRPRFANAEYFTGRGLQTDLGIVEMTADMAAGLEYYLIANGYVDRERRITEKYHAAASTDSLASLPEDLAPYKEAIFRLINSVFDDSQLPLIENEKNTHNLALNDNFKKRAFQKFWKRINHKAVYRVDFDSKELVKKAVEAVNRELQITPLQYRIEEGEQRERITHRDLERGTGFEVKEKKLEYNRGTVSSSVPYDLIGQIAEGAVTTRKTAGEILLGIDKAKFSQYRTNPEQFISQMIRIIKEQKASTVLEKLSYNVIDEKYDNAIFTENQVSIEPDRVLGPLKKHIYDYVVHDSTGERRFASELDQSAEIEVFAKLPRGFSIPTPVGDYNPDWAIAFKEGAVRHVYFVAETKGSMSTLQLRGIEEQKVKCAQKFFEKVNEKIKPENVKYSVVSDFGRLMDIVRGD